jgi:hypothetical protein
MQDAELPNYYLIVRRSPKLYDTSGHICDILIQGK